jgi:hypothetical protein
MNSHFEALIISNRTENISIMYVPCYILRVWHVRLCVCVCVCVCVLVWVCACMLLYIHEKTDKPTHAWHNIVKPKGTDTGMFFLVHLHGLTSTLPWCPEKDINGCSAPFTGAVACTSHVHNIPSPEPLKSVPFECAFQLRPYLVCWCMDEYMFVHVLVFVRMCMCACVDKHMCSKAKCYTHSRTHIYIYIYIYIYITHIYIYIYITHIFIYININVYVPRTLDLYVHAKRDLAWSLRLPLVARDGECSRTHTLPQQAPWKLLRTDFEGCNELCVCMCSIEGNYAHVRCIMCMCVCVCIHT